ncbi:RAD51-associated protein 1 [Genypterus blacodes]|uniref:RAD51-associated protein 1 n=1 Tax=Genypterus blacodes TaxID=154954 RepID=UPI003F7584D7
MERQSRKTKVVNYSEAKDFDDDEDFAHVKEPPFKKAREDLTQHKYILSTSTQELNSPATSSSNGRKPPGERLLERDLEAALTLSLLNPADGTDEQFPTSKGDFGVDLPVDENTDPSSFHVSNCSVDSSLLGLDKITGETDSRKRKPACKPTDGIKKLKNEDEDYRPKQTPDSESDDDFSDQAESEDEEFSLKKTSKTSKKEKRTKNEKQKAKPAAVSKKDKQPPKPSKPKTQRAAGVHTPVRTPTANVPSGPRRPSSSSSSPSTCRPAVHPSPSGSRLPKWNPPGQLGRSPTSLQTPAVKSPGQGLRLGLSRRVRVKPLHPSVSSH